MTATKDQEDYKNYIEKLEDDDDEGNGFIRTSASNLASGEDDSAGRDVNTDGSIIIDEDGSYYYQTLGKMVKVERLTKVSNSSMKKMVAVLPSNKWKKEDQIKSEVNNTKNLKYEESDVHSADTTITSEIGNEEKVYEFDENEQGQGDSQDIDDPDYESKVIIKRVKGTGENEPASFKCMICSYRTNKKFLLSRHLKTHGDERPFKCAVCERGFKTRAALNNHRNTHLGYKPHACSSCDMAFTTSGELIRHERYRHTHIKPHKCTECDYSSVELSKLRRHIRCHTGERPYQCPHCTYASPDTFKLKRHMRVHTGEKPYECDICHARFTQSNSLKHHRLIHSVNDKPVFQCNLCPTTCGRKTDLRLHIKNLHSSDQPIPCKRCGKELPDRYSYKMHIKTHEGEKCYRCEYCPYASISPRHLESHVFIHLNTKPFTCEICETNFRQKQLLTRHKKIYHSDNYEPPKKRKKDNKCPHCKKLFAFNGNLIRHMKIHDPTSRLDEEKHSLKMGRLKRVKPDGTAIIASESLSGDNEELCYEETEEQQANAEKFQAECEELEEYSEDNIQYIYEEYEADEYEEQPEDVECIQQKDKTNEKKTLIIDVKAEKIQEIDVAQSSFKNAIISSKDKQDSEIMILEEHDDQDFMVIEVMPDDEVDEEEQQERDQVHQIQLQKVKTTIINKSDNKSTVKKSHKNSKSLISDYFGFEINTEEENDDEEAKGVIQMIEMIEQD